MGVSRSERDPRIDVMRGAALLMIFVDHIPNNGLSWFTLHDFGFSDAADVFVLLAGFASMIAYGRIFERDGLGAGLRKVLLRCVRIYAYQVGLLLMTVLVVRTWCLHFGLTPRIIGPILNSPVSGLVLALSLQALPSYIDILPLYVVLLAAFPLLWMGMRRHPGATLAASIALWLAVQVHPGLDLPNALDDKGWYFNPFAWQLLFVLGMGIARLTQRSGGQLPRSGWAVALAWLYLAFAFLEAAPWHDWGLPDLSLWPMQAPDKSTMALLRIPDILALAYLVLVSSRLRVLAGHRLVRSVQACGKHSLEIFALGCTLALFGRLLFRTFGNAWTMQVPVNAAGIATMLLAALALERRGKIASHKLIEARQRDAFVSPTRSGHGSAL